MCAARANAFLFSKVFALCRSEDRILAISIKNGLVSGRAEVLANGSAYSLSSHAPLVSQPAMKLHL
jgi:hypothetical protein